MDSRLLAAAAAALFALIGAPAVAQDATPPGEPGAVADLSRCLTIPADAERLACLDRAARAIDAGVRSGAIQIVDRGQTALLRRETFGTHPAPADRLPPPSPAERIDAIETTLTRASQGADGRWTFVLADGGVWTQVDTDRVRITNRAGEPVTVRRASLGSYLLVVGHSGAVRVRRQ